MEHSVRGRSAPRLVVAILLAFVAFAVVRRSSAKHQAGDNAQSGSAIPSAKYVPEKSEGLGASVAILIDNSGSMKDRAGDDQRPKYLVAREALQAMLATTDSFVAQHPDFPVNVGIYRFSSDVTRLAPVAAYDRDALRTALSEVGTPTGGTAIGNAMDVARADLYRAGTIRKYILVVTDGQNTEGRSPKAVAREINQRSEGAVRMYFVAFDVEASRFDFVHDVNGEVLEARNGLALRASLDSIYRGKILAESTDAGEPPADTTGSRGAAPPAPDSSRSPSKPTRSRKPTP